MYLRLRDFLGRGILVLKQGLSWANLQFEGCNEQLQHRVGCKFAFNLRYPYSKNVSAICWCKNVLKWLRLFLESHSLHIQSHSPAAPLSLSPVFSISLCSPSLSAPHIFLPLLPKLFSFIPGCPFKTKNFCFFIIQKNLSLPWNFTFYVQREYVGKLGYSIVSVASEQRDIKKGIHWGR